MLGPIICFEENGVCFIIFGTKPHKFSHTRSKIQQRIEIPTFFFCFLGILFFILYSATCLLYRSNWYISCSSHSHGCHQFLPTSTPSTSPYTGIRAHHSMLLMRNHRLPLSPTSAAETDIDVHHKIAIRLSSPRGFQLQEHTFTSKSLTNRLVPSSTAPKFKYSAFMDVY